MSAFKGGCVPALVAVAALVLAGCVATPSTTGTTSTTAKERAASGSAATGSTMSTMTVPEPGAIEVSGDIQNVHDPSAVARDGNRYFLYTTGDGIPIRISDDMHNWRNAGDVFSSLPDWASKDVPGAGAIWAPDISFFNGNFHLYYAVSTFGSNHSDIGLATNATLDPGSSNYRWVDHGPVVQSRSYDSYNAIDPNLTFDTDGQPWLAFGSFWTGIKLIKIQPETGAPASGAKIYSIARRPDPPDAIEAPFIIHHNDYYYLFASYDFCCRAVDSTYNVRVGRSIRITGPYVDRTGKPMTEGGGTVIAETNGRWIGPGGESLFRAPFASGAASGITNVDAPPSSTAAGASADEPWVMIYHFYDGNAGGVPTMRMNTITWDADGWPEPLTPIAAPAD